jgi:hypothetical protein
MSGLDRLGISNAKVNIGQNQGFDVEFGFHEG